MKQKLMLLLTVLLFSVGLTMAQSRTISGTVISSEDNQPVIGASVLVKGTTIGSVTDTNGKFTIKGIPSTAKVFVISYIGMISKEVDIKPNIKVVLEPETSQIDEVVVVAFGKAKKSAFTGSVAQVNEKEISQRQISNVTEALAGKSPGITVSSSNNQPGTSSSIRIRGIGSFSASSAPLYVVDGVPYDGDISAINPQDIRSVSILKDAASAALYGARGANGVIMITTKGGEGQTSKMSVTAEVRYGFNQLGVAEYDMIKDPKVYAAKYFEGIYNYASSLEGATPESAMKSAIDTYFSTNEKVANLKYPSLTFPEGTAPFVRMPDGTFRTADGTTVGSMYEANGQKYWVTPDDWTDRVFHTNPRQEYNVSVSGRSDKANYYMSVGYLDDEGYVTGSSFNRITSRLRSDFRPFKWMTLSGNIGYTHYKSNMLSDTGEMGDSGNVFAMTNFVAPFYPMYVRGEDKCIIRDKWNHKIYDFGAGDYPGLTRPYQSMSNPLALYELDTNNHVADIVSAKGAVDFNIYEGLKATINIGYDVDNTYHTSTRNPFYGQYAKSGGTLTKEFTRSHSINTQQLVTYLKSFGKHNMDFLLGHEFYKRVDENLYGMKSNMYWPGNKELNGAILDPRTGSTSGEYGTEGYLGRIQYDYNNKYFGQFSYRRDASSRFDKDNRWGNFWSVGASWLISREDFMASLKRYVDMLKLKVSYGMQGNDAIGSFRFQDIYAVSNSNDQMAVSFTSKGNKDITWETSKNLNIGLEFATLKERLSGEVDFYIREVSDMLFWRPVPRSAGYAGYYDNIGSMKNTGVDFTLTGVLLKKRNALWTLSVNGGYFKNKLTKLPKEWEEKEDGYRDGWHVYRVGGSFYDKALPKYLGVNEEGRPIWQTYDKKTGEYGSTEDHSVAMEEHNRVIRTDMAPKLNGGISTNLKLYDFDFSMTLSYALGGNTYDDTYAALMHGGAGDQSGSAWHKDILKSWTPEHHSDIPMVNYGGKWANAFSDRFIVSRDYLALNNITLGYTLPNKLLSAMNMKEVRIYLVGDNLGLISARKGFDPRFGGGIGYKAVRSFSAGLRVTL